MTEGAERIRDVLGQRAHVRPLAASNAQHSAIRRLLEEIETIDEDASRRARHLDAGTRILVMTASAEFERRVRRRHLLRGALERGERRRQLIGSEGYRGLADDLAFGVARRGADAEAHGRDILLARIEQRL